jgi:DNA-binding XRE family transcriptional regulator
MRRKAAPRQLETLYFLKFAVKRGAMINTAQIRAARGLLKWTQATLAHRAALSTVTLNMIENETVRPRDSTLASIKSALENGGVEFLDKDGIGVGVKFAA